MYQHGILFSALDGTDRKSALAAELTDWRIGGSSGGDDSRSSPQNARAKNFIQLRRDRHPIHVSLGACELFHPLPPELQIDDNSRTLSSENLLRYFLR